MRARDRLRSLVQALTREPARTLLTVAGIGVGAFAVAVLISLGTAIKQTLAGSLRGLGENLVIVTPEPRRTGTPTVAAARAAPEARLSEGDVRAVRSLDSVQRAAAVLTAPCVASVRSRSVRTTCIGADAAYLEVARIVMAEGAEFSFDADVAPRAEAILGTTVRRRLLVSDEALDTSMQVGARRLRVVGVAAPRGVGVGGADEDDFILVPKAYARQQLTARDSPTDVDAIFALARPAAGPDSDAPGASSDATRAAVDDIASLLARRRHVEHIDDLLSVASLSSLLAAGMQASDLLTALLAGMAAVSIAVGGVGIVNVMLTNVAERRLEIGLKLALGASPRLVASEFLLEAVVLAAAGAFAGVAAAGLLALALSAGPDLHVTLTPTAAGLAIGLSLVVGITAGAWPARRAARLDPREILRDA